MLNEKNPFAAQALSEDELDGVVGGVGNVGNCQNLDGSYTFNGVTYSSLSAMPDDVKSEYKSYLYNYCRASVFGTMKSCARCGRTSFTGDLEYVEGHGNLCPDCAFKARPRSTVESHSRG